MNTNGNGQLQYKTMAEDRYNRTRWYTVRINAEQRTFVLKIVTK